MKSKSFLLTPLFAMLWLLLFIQIVLAQTNPQGEKQDSRAVLVKLSAPAYPPLARQARIMGYVKLKAEIRPDGSVASAEVIDGHPILKQAASESAQKSKFECRDCKDITALVLTYSFRLRDTADCSVRRLRSVKCLYFWKCGGWRNSPPRQNEITQSPDRITILADPPCVETNYSHSAGD